MKRKNFYEILGVDSSADLSAIKKSYKDLVATNHPDKHPEDPAAHERFVEITEAFRALAKPKSRRDYDQWLHTQRSHKPTERQQPRPSSQNSSSVRPEDLVGPISTPPNTPSEPKSTGAWVGVAAGVAVVFGAAYVANRWAPKDPTTSRHRSRKTGQFRKGYVR